VYGCSSLYGTVLPVADRCSSDKPRNPFASPSWRYRAWASAWVPEVSDSVGWTNDPRTSPRAEVARCPKRFEAVVDWVIRGSSTTAWDLLHACSSRVHTTRRLVTMRETAASVDSSRGNDVVCLLLSEHAGLRMDFARAVNQASREIRRVEFLEFARMWVRHETAEQLVVYPVIARIDGGDELRSEMLRQERNLAAALARLLRRLVWRPSGRRTLRRIQSFSELLEDHLAAEERSLVPILLALASEQKRQLMGTWLRRAEATSPLRPHPHGPQRPAGLLTIGLAIGIVDRVRNAGPLAAKHAVTSGRRTASK
jgi:hypothetical protein